MGHLNPTPTTSNSRKIIEKKILGRQNTCGIIGVVGTEKSGPASKYLMEGLTILQNRGYDSAGICTIRIKEKHSKLIISKYASKNSTSDALKILQNDLPKHKADTVGIAHTRWATHGGKTDFNAHPHTDVSGKISLVHNGVIENSQQLKNILVSKGVKFSSETDTEVIVQWIGFLYNSGKSLVESIKETIHKLDGTWGLVIMSSENPHEIYATRNGSPLLLGIGENQMFIASESSAFSRYTKRMMNLEDMELVVLNSSGVKEMIHLKGKTNKKDLKDRVVELENDEEILLTPDPYPHWTIKEILEQPESISRSLNYGGRIDSSTRVRLGGLEANKEWLENIEHLIIAACGTSYYSGLFGAYLMRKLKCFDTVQVVDAAELQPYDFPRDCSKAGLLVISQSGETRDVLNAMKIAEELNIPSFSIINKVGSLIARTTGCGVYVNAGRECGVASTKAFTSQVTCLALIAVWFSQQKSREKYNTTQNRKFVISSLRSLPMCVGQLLKTIDEDCINVAKVLQKHHTIFILGKGIGLPIALEGSLKIKEITYTHAEAYASGALKHGPFALINEGIPIIMVILDDKHLSLNITSAHETSARGAHVIAITDMAKSKLEKLGEHESKGKKSNIFSQIISVPNCGIMSAVACVIPFQLIAYRLSLLKDINPDKPKHLAKTVTVQ